MATRHNAAKPLTRVNWALLREIPRSLNECQHEFQQHTRIDVHRARFQQQQYGHVLQSLGLTVEILPADETLPDCCFVEDTGVLIGHTAVICRPGAESRRVEVVAVQAHLEQAGFEIASIQAPGTLDGGDVLQVGEQIFVGLSRRTNLSGIEQFAEFARRQSRTVHSIEVRGALHLKTVCTALDEQTLIGVPEHLGRGKELLDAYRFWDVTHEPDAANLNRVNEHVLAPAHCHRTICQLRDAGYSVHEVDITELHKAEAGLTCMALLGQRPSLQDNRPDSESNARNRK